VMKISALPDIFLNLPIKMLNVLYFCKNYHEIIIYFENICHKSSKKNLTTMNPIISQKPCQCNSTF